MLSRWNWTLPYVKDARFAFRFARTAFLLLKIKGRALSIATPVWSAAPARGTARRTRSRCDPASAARRRSSRYTGGAGNPPAGVRLIRLAADKKDERDRTIPLGLVYFIQDLGFGEFFGVFVNLAHRRGELIHIGFRSQHHILEEPHCFFLA